MEIVINRKYGGFSLSLEALKTLEKMGVYNIYDMEDPVFDNDRSNPLLVSVVKELGPRANGLCANLKIVTIPDDVKWEIVNDDGVEHVAEIHRTWC